MQTEKIGYFNNKQKILVVGDGNLTFSLSLAQSLKDVVVYATTFLSLQELWDAYGKEDIDETITKLNEETNVKVLHGIDATKLHTYDSISSFEFTDVIFNFPCITPPDV
jgi:25S rRNA (uracil2634-N3)-methyltransferase